MNLIKVQFVEKVIRTSSVESFRFIPSQKLEFLPGQFAKVMFDSAKEDNKELNKYLSFSSSPSKPYIEFTKRLSESVFSQRLKSLKPNDEILVKAPMGTCALCKDSKKIGFLIGGIGITPVISIIETIVGQKLPIDVVLFYSNRTDDDIAFLKELNQWKSEDPLVKIIYTVTDCQPRETQCRFGRIDQTLLENYARDNKERLWFIFGPPKMVEGMKELCFSIGIPKEHIKSETFVGY